MSKNAQQIKSDILLLLDCLRTPRIEKLIDRLYYLIIIEFETRAARAIRQVLQFALPLALPTRMPVACAAPHGGRTGSQPVAVKTPLCVGAIC